MKIILLMLALISITGCKSKWSDPFILKKVEHKIDGSWGGVDRTILTSNKGAKHILKGLLDTPPVGSTIRVRNSGSGKGKIQVLKSEEEWRDF